MTGCSEPRPGQQPNDQGRSSQGAFAQAQTANAAAELTAKVIGIIDGDTIDVLTVNNESIRLKLNGIDAPELDQPFGADARQYLNDTIAGSLVRVVTHGEETDGRTRGDIYANVEFHQDTGDMTGGTFVNLLLIEAGLAWHDAAQAPEQAALAEAQEQARDSDKGLWLSPHGSIPPWEWRTMTEDQRDEFR